MTLADAPTAADVPAERKPVIEIDNVSKVFTDFTAVDRANFAIGEGEFFSMLGPSGCGKTTTLRMIAGFETPTSGAIRLEGQDVSRVPPNKRDVNTVFQQYALFPHMSVWDNVAYGPRAKKIPKDEVARRVDELLGVVKLTDFAQRRPSQLSGGQQQRVALARALVNYPKALLLDEPLGALDLKLRQNMQLELKRIQRELGITFIFVTHDQEEALTMSDRIAVMNLGRVEQIGSPREIYDRPATVFVAGFIGQANLWSAVVTAKQGSTTTIEVAGRQLDVSDDSSGLGVGEHGTFMVRPERMYVEPQLSDPDRWTVDATVTELVFQGPVVRYELRLPDGSGAVAHVPARRDGMPIPGDVVQASWSDEASVLLPGTPDLAPKPEADLPPIPPIRRTHRMNPNHPGAGHMNRRPSDPELAAAIAMARRLSRRRFLTQASLGMGAVALGPSLLAACGSSDSDGGSDGGSGGGGDKELAISNWTAYIDQDDSGTFDAPGTTIDLFQQETGIAVTYKEDYNDNDEYFNKFFSPVLGKGDTLAADIVVPTYWMAARIIGLDWVEELPLDDIPNHANLVDNYLDLAWDPGATKHMPWQAGITGIAWNPALTGRDLTSANDLFDEEFAGKVTFLTELRDSVGLTMFAQGTDPSKGDLDEINAALDKIEEATTSGQILKFTGNEYLRSLENGDVAACVAWSGDIAQLNPELGIKFAIPEEGGMQWFDTMVVPKGAPNMAAAAKWMNFVYDPENAARITEYVQYVSPVKGVREALEAAGGDAAALAENPLLFPDDETSSRLKVFAELAQEDEIDVQTRFNDITG